MSNLSAPYLHDEEAAYAFLEGVMWPNGATCPHCGGTDRISKVKANPEKRIRLGLHRCGDCKKQFTVKVGTVFEASKVKLNLWLQAVVLMTSSKKGISSHQLHRVLGVTYKTAWFMEHRIREAMRSGELAPFGGNGGAVEADETFIGREPGKPKKRAYHHKMKVLSLVDRETGRARSIVVDDIKRATIEQFVGENVAREARLMTDEAAMYTRIGAEFADHQFVSHGKGEYGRGDTHTNTIEGYFSIFKRGMKGVYQHCGKRHLHRYVAEFEFRYNNRSALGVGDHGRAVNALTGTKGKRLKYHGPDSEMA
ncbi:Transposase zinc-ribbon domain-containing protein [Albimonas donghaensis]|uniref:Transposase zinc-ribbon domain-containing protein n=1 Tax=Albimonas donghaensis TaxID=356660 RepID=A0A1H2WPV2_9RHOB|nr:IS1595 family transposase [Albimonas donghaensis]SDW82486.1 Transposase zinc-ribbon domain-containing protein [Albimonas donghaensis]